MFGSYTEKLLLDHAIQDSVCENKYFKLKYDYILGHDATFSLIIDEIKKINVRKYNKKSLILVADHFCPPATVDRANILNKFLKFTEENKLTPHVFEGICHQILVEHAKILPNQVILGTDSHTVTASALGSLAFGLGSYDILYSLITGHTVFKYKKIVKITLTGTIPENISGKDIILCLLKMTKEGGGNYIIWEIEDRTTNKLSQDDRFAFSNMCVEAGAISAIFVPDEITYKYFKEIKNHTIDIDQQKYNFLGENINIDVSKVIPQIAKPHSPANVTDVQDVKGVKLSQVFIGSCASGRLSELGEVAKIVKGKKIKVKKAILIPSSIDIYKSAFSLGYIGIFLEAGFIVGNPSCGPCGKIDKGVLGDDDVCLSTSNRNYRGRMGSLKAEIYLASARTCAVSALEGKICCP